MDIVSRAASDPVPSYGLLIVPINMNKSFQGWKVVEHETYMAASDVYPSFRFMTKFSFNKSQVFLLPKSV